MNEITLSKWQEEVLREAFAMLAREEAARLRASGTSLAKKDGDAKSQQEEQLSFAI